MTRPMTDCGGAAVFGLADVPLPTAAEAAAADAHARQDRGIPERLLMENAARAAAQLLQLLYPAGRVVAVAGPGNNGGDAAVMLRVLHRWGRDVCLVPAAERTPAEALLHGERVPVAVGSAADRALASADVLVDGLLGTGATGPPREWARGWIDRLNAHEAPTIALDLPSGIDATTGAVHGTAVRAHCTVSFGWPKLGLLLHPARACCGRLIAVEIGFPPDALQGVRAQAITPLWVRTRLPARAPDAHKGSAGRLLVLAGSSGMAGAAAIAVEAALRTGAGLVRIASDAANRVVLQGLVPEATFIDRSLIAATDTDGMHALVAGPGLGQGDDAAAALHRALALTAGVPTLLDADALNILARDATELARIAAGRPLVVTPHALELARLTGTAVGEITADMPAHARTAAARFGCTVLLKGQPSLIAQPDGTLLINTSGSSDLAAAGMGDQLAGAIGALLAAGAPTPDAAGAGLYLSGRAADLCGLGRALLPRDVSHAMARAIAWPGAVVNPLALPFITFDQPARW
jgi:NAD(P)H-hydrate epimerase